MFSTLIAINDEQILYSEKPLHIYLRQDNKTSHFNPWITVRQVEMFIFQTHE